ncbi:MAG: hypothetical protein R3B72_49925 [Polyangiaceae bacterium]
MLEIEVHFENAYSAPTTIGDATHAVGVYSLWTKRSTIRPTYLGQGHLVDRLRAAKKVARAPGYMPLVAVVEGPDAKAIAEIVEHLLLHCAEAVGRYPLENGPRGTGSALEESLDAEAMVSITISGRDPLRGSRLTEAKVMGAWLDDDEDVVFSIPWQRL